MTKMTVEDGYQYPPDDGAEYGVPEGYVITYFEEPFELIDTTGGVEDRKSVIDLCLDANEYPRRFEKSDMVKATVQDKRGVLTRGVFQVKKLRFNEAMKYWEYKLTGAGDKYFREGLLSKA